MGKKKQNEETPMDGDLAIVNGKASDTSEAKKAPKPQRKMVLSEVKLTDTEIIDLADELADKHDALADAITKRKNMTDNLKSEEAEITARINSLVRKISSKVDAREFFCEAVLDFDLKVKRWVDVATGDVRKVEDLTAQDFQMKLRYEEENAEVEAEATDDDQEEFRLYVRDASTNGNWVIAEVRIGKAENIQVLVDLARVWAEDKAATDYNYDAAWKITDTDGMVYEASYAEEVEG